MTPLSTTLRSRWREGATGYTPPIRKQFDNVLDLVDQVAAKRTALAADKNLSDIGRADELKKFGTSVAARLAKAVRTVEIATGSIAEKRAALVPSVKDKTDVAGAMLRREQRDVLRTMKPADMVAILTDKETPTSMLEAIFEAPNLVPEIPEGVKESVVAALLERIAGPAVADLRGQEEAVGLLKAAVRGSSEILRAAVDVQPGGFDGWLAEAAPPDPKAVEAEKAQFQAESVEAGAMALPLKARMSLVESLLATNTAEITTK